MMLIKNGRVINPGTKQDEVTDVLINGGIICKIEKNMVLNEAVPVIDAKGLVVAPGLIDVHVHFRDPGMTHKEDIQSGSEAAARGGFTTVVCMANTSPVVDNEDTLSYIINEGKKAKINVLQTAAITKGLKGEETADMEKLAASGAVGFTDDGIPIMNGRLIMEVMEKAKKLNMPLSFHEEDPSLVVNPGINHGAVSERLGMTGAYREAEEVMIARDCALAVKTGAKINIQHVSSGNSVDIIRDFKKRCGNIAAEVTPHHFSLTEEDVLKYGTNAKMNPPLRTEEDRMKLIEGLKDDTIEIIATDHAPHSREEKDREFAAAPSGITGLETSLSLGITYLVRDNHLSLMKLLEKMTINPAGLYNLDAGSLEAGKTADIVIFDPDEKYVVDKFVSKSANTPFAGHELYGRVKYTICGGEIVYEDTIITNPEY